MLQLDQNIFQNCKERELKMRKLVEKRIKNECRLHGKSLCSAWIE
jgi:hypothetical protein